jgi:hypothetical protein
MTSGAVGSLSICRSELLGSMAYTKREAAQCDDAIRDGLAWLGRHFTVRGNPGRRGTTTTTSTASSGRGSSAA